MVGSNSVAVAVGTGREADLTGLADMPVAARGNTFPTRPPGKQGLLYWAHWVGRQQKRKPAGAQVRRRSRLTPSCIPRIHPTSLQTVVRKELARGGSVAALVLVLVKVAVDRVFNDKL